MEDEGAPPQTETSAEPCFKKGTENSKQMLPVARRASATQGFGRALGWQKMSRVVWVVVSEMCMKDYMRLHGTLLLLTMADSCLPRQQ